MKIISTIKHGLTFGIALAGLLALGSGPVFADKIVKTGSFDKDVIVTADDLVVRADIAADLIAAGEDLMIDSNIKGDAFLTGGDVEVLNTIDGRLLVMGGDVELDARIKDGTSLFVGRASLRGVISGDALAMGGVLDFDGEIDGDMRAVGGKLILRNIVNGKVLASGGKIEIKDGATINGKVTLGGGTVYLGGHITGDLRVAARDVVLTGQIDGNVKIAAKTIKVLPSARISGDLVYHSPEAIQLSDQADIGGDVTFMQSESIDDQVGGMFAIAGATHLVLIISLVLLASAFVLALPKLFPALDRQSRGRNWSCVGLGLAVLVGGPLLISLLFVSAIGIPIGVLLIAVYFLMVITGQFGSSYVLGRRFISWTRHDATRKPLYRIGATALGLFAIWILAIVPVLGIIVVILATARGVGALVFEVVELRTRFGQPV
jgi:cytoskeletal protein CcmA (bactofilin family)